MTDPPLLPHSLPKAPSPKTIILGIRVSTYEFGMGEDTDTQSIAPCLYTSIKVSICSHLLWYMLHLVLKKKITRSAKKDKRNPTIFIHFKNYSVTRGLFGTIENILCMISILLNLLSCVSTHEVTNW